jgi:hypothetical protein
LASNGVPVLKLCCAGSRLVTVLASIFLTPTLWSNEGVGGCFCSSLEGVAVIVVAGCICWPRCLALWSLSAAGLSLLVRLHLRYRPMLCLVAGPLRCWSHPSRVLLGTLKYFSLG